MDSSTGQPMLKIPAAVLAAMHRAARQLGSPVEAAALVRQIGYESGEGFLEEFTGWLMHHRQDPGVAPSDLSAEEFWHLLSAFFGRIGWGRLHFEQLHEGVAALRSQDWVEGRVVEQARQPSCHYTTGMLADLLGRLTDSEVAVLEVSCLARGDGSCRFLFGSPEGLQHVYEGLRSGQAVDEVLRALA